MSGLWNINGAIKSASTHKEKLMALYSLLNANSRTYKSAKIVPC